MNTLLAGVVSASILFTACGDSERKIVHDTTSMDKADCEAIALAIQSQYATILSTYNSQESLMLRLSDHSASLVITMQSDKIIMVQLTTRNLYPNDPDMAPTPYTDIHGDGVLETQPTDTKTLPQSSLTYGNYLALLTRFGIPTEVKSDEIPLEQNNISKDRKIDIARDIMPPPSPLDVLNRISP